MAFQNNLYARYGQAPPAAASAGPQLPGKVGGAHHRPAYVHYGQKNGAHPPSRHDSRDMPQLGATFVPGGCDDYYMPEVVAPLPQRVMPEVPQNMQNDLQRMELEANSVASRTTSDSTSPPPPDQYTRLGREPSLSGVLANKGGAKTEQSSDYTAFKDKDSNTYANMASSDLPSFSPFPKVQGDNIPPSDDEKEEILYNAREHVLHSNNVDMQLSWARDSLAWCEIEAEAHMRENNGQMVRPQTPKIEHELRVDAANIIFYLSDQRHPDALFMKAKWSEFGKFGQRLDKRDAYNGYKDAASVGCGRAYYRMGMLHENSNDISKAIQNYEKGRALRDSAACYRLGMMNLLGQHGHPKDFARGLELIQEAANTADEDAPQGAYVYGMLIAKDLPDIEVNEALLPSNMNFARQYVEKAAYLGFAKALLKMGQAYELCQLGCDFNPALSLHYYGLGARQGQPEAALGVSRWFLFGYEGVFSKNEQLAYKYAKYAADAKLHTGEFAMGYYNEIGIHVQKDLREARNWYEKSAEHGNKDAVGRLESLSHHNALTKQDHETTGLTRIKSKHGSQRGKRPDRFKQNTTMPTLTESGSNTPARLSPAQSPRHGPTQVQDSVDFPDPAYQRQPAFGMNVNANLAMRPKSAAPYPEDDRPSPYNRSRSAAPYPEDDVAGHKPPLSPHHSAGIRPSQGPHADRPLSAFGIRANSPNGQAGEGHAPSPGGMRMSQSTGNLAPYPPAGANPAARGRMASGGPGWDSQDPSGFRQPSPGPGRRPVPPAGASQPGPYDQPYGGPAANSPAQNRLQKQNTGMGPPKPMPSGPPGQFPMGPAGAPGYGPRSSSRIASADGPRQSVDSYGYPPAGGRPPTADRPNRVDSMPPPLNPAQTPTGGPRPGGVQLQDRPPQINTNAGRASAPPAQMGRGKTASPAPSSAAPSIASAGGKNKAPQGQGPATFEAMGIPQGKSDDDCCVM